MMGRRKRGKEFRGDGLARLHAEACRFHDEVRCIRSSSSYSCGRASAAVEEEEDGEGEGGDEGDDGTWGSGESAGYRIREPSRPADGNRSAKASERIDEFRGSFQSAARIAGLGQQPLSEVKTPGEGQIGKGRSRGSAVVGEATRLLRSNNSTVEPPASSPRKNPATEIRCSVQAVVCNACTQADSRKILMNSEHEECRSHADGLFRITATTFFTANRGQLVLSTPSFHDETVERAVKTVPESVICCVNVESKVREEAECSQQQTTACSIPPERTEVTGKSSEDTNRTLAAAQGKPVTFHCRVSDSNEVGTFLKELSGALEQTMGLENEIPVARNRVPAEPVISSTSLYANVERLAPIANARLHSHSHVCTAVNTIPPGVIAFSDKESKQEVHKKKSTAESPVTNLHSQNELSTNIIELDNQHQQDKTATSLSSTHNAEPISTSLVLDSKGGTRKSSSAVRDVALARRMALRIRCILEVCCPLLICRPHTQEKN